MTNLNNKTMKKSKTNLKCRTIRSEWMIRPAIGESIHRGEGSDWEQYRLLIRQLKARYRMAALGPVSAADVNMAKGIDLSSIVHDFRLYRADAAVVASTALQCLFLDVWNETVSASDYTTLAGYPVDDAEDDTEDRVVEAIRVVSPKVILSLDVLTSERLADTLIKYTSDLRKHLNDTWSKNTDVAALESKLTPWHTQPSLSVTVTGWELNIFMWLNTWAAEDI